MLIGVEDKRIEPLDDHLARMNPGWEPAKIRAKANVAQFLANEYVAQWRTAAARAKSVQNRGKRNFKGSTSVAC